MCIVTGAGSGIGKATAIRLAEEGGKVLCVDLNLESAQATTQEILEMNGVVLATKADVGNVDQANAFVARAVETWGQIDVLVNNAGVNLPGIFHEVSDATINKTLDVNVKGPSQRSDVRQSRRDSAHARTRLGFNRQHLERQRFGFRTVPGGLFRLQGCCCDADPWHRARLCRSRDSLQLHLSRLGGHTHQCLVSQLTRTGSSTGQTWRPG